MTTFMPVVISYYEKIRISPNDNAPSNSAVAIVAVASTNSPPAHAIPASLEIVQTPQSDVVVAAQIATPEDQDDDVYVVSAVVVE